MCKTYISVIELYKISIESDNLRLLEWSGLSIIKDDSQGQLFSLDLLFALIPFAIILALVASDMDNVMYMVEDAVFQGSSDRVAADTVNTLLKTSGQPTTWEQTGSATVAGLAPNGANNIPILGTIFAAKVGALSSTDIQKMVGNNYGFFLNITTMDGSTSLRNLSSIGGYNDSASDIVKVERDSLYSNVVYSIVGQIKGSGVSRPYNTWTFNCFQTNYNSNISYDYWIVVNNSVNPGYNASSVTVTINNGTMALQNASGNAYNIVATKINSSFLNLNPGAPVLNTITVNANATNGAYMDFYIIQVPKNSGGITLASKDQIACKVNFYLWKL